MTVATGTAVEQLEVVARTIPTDAPESDGTLEWDSTTIVVVQARAGGKVGLGYTYTHDAAARLIEDKLAPLVRGGDLDDVPALWDELGQQLRNIGRPGIGFMALSAVDVDTELYVDANGAFDPEDAVAWAERYAREWGVTWFEEPVSSADVEDLRLVCQRAPEGLEITAGEYAFVPADFRNLLEA